MIEGLEYIYKITSPSNRVYIGKTKSWRKRFDHYIKNGNKITQPKLQYSINKYGWEAHKLELIELYESQKIDDRERYWIKYYNSYHYDNEKGLNLTLGGEGGKGSQKPLHGVAVEQRDKNTLEVIKVWENGVGQIERETAFNNQPIYEAIKGEKQIFAYGYLWNYVGNFKGVRGRKKNKSSNKLKEKYKNGFINPSQGKVGKLNSRSRAVFIEELSMEFESLNLAAEYFKQNIFKDKTKENIYGLLHKNLKNKVKNKKWTIKYI